MIYLRLICNVCAPGSEDSGPSRDVTTRTSDFLENIARTSVVSPPEVNEESAESPEKAPSPAAAEALAECGVVVSAAPRASETRAFD